MSEPVLVKNVDRVFAVLDLNSDGLLEWRDFETKVIGISRAFGLTADSPEARGVLAGYQELWHYIRGAADSDRDDAVTKEEFEQAHLARRLSTETVADLWADVANRVFDVVDRDDDGYIDLEGLVVLYLAGDVPEAEHTATIAFASMDADSDGRVDKTEFTANVRGIFTATDESAKGAHMLDY